MANALTSKMAALIGKARVAGGGVNIRHGVYPSLLVKKMFFGDMNSGPCFILELRVHEAPRRIDVVEGTVTRKDVEPNAIGTECSLAVNFDGAGKLSAKSNVRAVILGLFGMEDDKVSDDQVEATVNEICSDAQPARGMLIGLSTFPKMVRSKKDLPDNAPGKWITGLKWECVAMPGEGRNSQAEVAKRRAALDRAAAAEAEKAA